MKKLFYIPAPFFLSGFLFFSSSLLAQNLVSNPSFEQYTICPTTQGEVLKATGWHSYGWSPDYFNSCNGGTFSVPSNALGYQPASTGNAYVGFGTYGNIYPDSSGEFIGTQLSSPLIIGQTYNVSFKTSFAFKQTATIDCACNKIGILFSTKSYSVDSVCPPPCTSINYLLPFKNNAHIYSPTIITDTSGWEVVSGNFIADSAYQFIIIGNFFDSSNITCIDFDTTTSSCNSYYFFDDVLVIPDSLSGIKNSRDAFAFSVFPIPARETLKIYSIEKNDFSIFLFDALGKQLFFLDKLNSYCTLDLSTLQAGVYHLHIFSDEQTIHKKIIHIK